jgi:hypothetical protein
MKKSGWIKMVVEAVIGKDRKTYFISPSLDWLLFVSKLGKLQLPSYRFSLIQGAIIPDEAIQLLEDLDSNKGEFDARILNNLTPILEKAVDNNQTLVFL